MVSIVIPVYNVEQYILRCLRSVVKQESVRDIECIIVDDCSTDNSMQLAMDFVSNYTGDIRFHIVRHKTNKGLSAARNTGTRFASTSSDWIYYLDSDDEIKADCIHTLLMTAARYPQAEMICGNTLTLPNINADHWRDITLKKNLPLYIESNETANEYYFDVTHIHDWLPVNAWNKLINTKFLRDNNISFCEGLIHEDELWMFDIMKYINCLASTTERTYVHYQTEGSITRSGQERRSCKHRIAIAQWELAHLTPEYSSIQKEKIFFQLADVYERALAVSYDFHKEVKADIKRLANGAHLKLPRAFRRWFMLPPKTARVVAPLIRKILIS